MNTGRGGLLAYVSAGIAAVLLVISVVRADAGWCTCVNVPPCDELYLYCPESCCCCRASQAAMWLCDCHTREYCKRPGGTIQCIE